MGEWIKRNICWPKDFWGISNFSTYYTSTNEFSTAPLFRESPFKYRNAEIAFQKYDRNGDGIINFDEFVEIVLDDLNSLPPKPA